MEPSVECVSTSRSGVGESPVWSVSKGRLYWVDITGRTLRALDPATRREEAWAMPEIVTSVGLCRDGRLVVGLRKRVCLFTPGGSPETLAEIETDRPANRLNEGAVAPDGSYWVGTMRDNIAPDGSAREVTAWTGALWRVAPDGAVSPLGPDGLGIANLMAWHGGRFATADTLADAIHLHAWDGGALGAPVMTHWGGAPGAPDGGTFDTAGQLWNARFGGGCLMGLDPARPTAPTVVDLPCTNPTSCAFGGPDLGTLFVTSATFGLDAAAIGPNSIEGGLLALSVGRAGRPPNLFG